jgi:hypothetical protein
MEALMTIGGILGIVLIAAPDGQVLIVTTPEVHGTLDGV